MDKYFESFLLFKPKEVVSGDFYWFYSLDPKTCFVAVVDCTGHGVPGAFMSLIGYRLLNEIIEKEKIHDPAKVLDHMDKGIRKALSQDKTNNTDGMDVCLVKLISEDQHFSISKCVFAGAKRKLFIYHDENGDVEVKNGDRRSIGGLRSHHGTKVVFSNQSCKLNPGDILYLTSDGFIDQNSPKRERFGIKSFVNLLNTITQHTLSEQK